MKRALAHSFNLSFIALLVPTVSSFTTPRAAWTRYPTSFSQRQNDKFDTPISQNAAADSNDFVLDGSWIIESMPVVGSIVKSPVFWSGFIMATIVTLLYVWDEFTVFSRKKLHPSLIPVLDSMLQEMGSLGFIGLFLGVFVTGGPFGSVVGSLSEHFWGDEGVLLESFEFLHTAFFEVAIAFFLAAGTVVSRVISQIETLQGLSLSIFDLSDDGTVALEELATYLKVKGTVLDKNQDNVLNDDEISAFQQTVKRDPLWKEAFISIEEIEAETLVVRERFVENSQIPPSFKIEDYFVPIFGKNLKDLVELSPLIWLPLIPALSLGRSIDMSRDIVSASSQNAYMSCGDFISDPLYFPIVIVVVTMTLAWGVWNFIKVTTIKQMLLPVLVRDSNVANSRALLLPPRYESEILRKEFNSSPGVVSWIESFYSQPATSSHEELFGVAGAAGPELYRNSIKNQTWILIAQVVFWGFQIVGRDFQALLEGWQVQDVETVWLEFVTFGSFVLISLLQLLLAPQTFVSFCLVTSIESLTDDCIMSDALATTNEDWSETTVEISRGLSK